MEVSLNPRISMFPIIHQIFHGWLYISQGRIFQQPVSSPIPHNKNITMPSLCSSSPLNASVNWVEHAIIGDHIESPSQISGRVHPMFEVNPLIRSIRTSRRLTREFDEPGCFFFDMKEEGSDGFHRARDIGEMVYRSDMWDFRNPDKGCSLRTLLSDETLQQALLASLRIFEREGDLHPSTNFIPSLAGLR
ncbi:hypothetical protein C8Q75DRAFT_868885 [Abortiporus biennis]|nr:hypothetical protein C8Q75DRAFT_868885 [Abortiporus biennis]